MRQRSEQLTGRGVGSTPQIGQPDPEQFSVASATSEFRDIGTEEAPSQSDLPALVTIPVGSPTQTDFGYDFRSDSQVPTLPEQIGTYLEEHNLDAFYVPTQGDCAFGAVTFHPKWTKTLIARLGGAAYLAGLKGSNNGLRDTVSSEQVQKMRTRTSRSYSR
jgi:hypothetical protein